jgi:LmbE family N-acetylglucosaminyl deacetylase
MKNKKTGRRQFVKTSLAGFGSFSLSSLLSTAYASDYREKAVLKKLNVICIGAHPGDPEFGCGGTMLKFSKAGHAVSFLYLTRGEAYNANQSFEQSAALRTKEAETSCKILNVTPMFMGQVDANTELNKQRNEEATKLILSQKPDIVFTQWPIDAHPDHQVAGLLTLTAWIRANKQFHLYFYEVNTGSETMNFTPSEYVDISDVRQTKKAALMAHQTQAPQDVYDSFFKKMEDFRGLEANVKAAEAFIYFKPNDGRNSIAGL